MSSPSKREFRVFSQQIAVDTTSDASKVSGYAARFNELSEDLGGFKELIAPGAFTKTLQGTPDVRALIDHDPAKVIGRTTAGTLTLTQDEQGLAFICELPGTSYARDLAISMDRGDITGCSFGFYCDDDTWAADPSGRVIRTIHSLSVFEVTICAFPAYPTTSAQVRSLFPDGIPEDLAKHQRSLPDACTCPCDECLAGDCASCTDADCTCPGCDRGNDVDDPEESESLRSKMHMQLQLISL